MNYIKKLSILLFSILLLGSQPKYNLCADEFSHIDNDDVFYVETIITSDFDIEKTNQFNFSNKFINTLYSPKLLSSKKVAKAAKSITKTKTSYYRAKDRSLLWSVSIKATFTYDGNTSKCTSCSHSASAPAKTWSIKSVSSHKTGNSATATAVATHTSNAGAKNYTRSITIKCNKNGVVS